MRLDQIAWLADENIDPIVCDRLRAAGFNIVTAADKSLLGRPDTDIMREAFASQRAILTHDSDFGTLAVANSEPLIGILHLRPGHASADFTLASIEALLAHAPPLNPQPPFILVAHRRGSGVMIRLRHLA